MCRPTLGALGVFVLALTGCITTLDVQKADLKPAGPKGIRYALPVPLLQVCPGPGETLSVQEIFLPDEDNSYAISAKTYGAKFNLNVELEDGLLKKLQWNPDSTAVAEKVAESTGNLAKTKFEADAKQAEEEAKKADAEATAQKTALEAADKAVRDAEGELRVAAATLAALREQPGATTIQIVAAEVDVAKARARLENAMEARARLHEQLGISTSNISSNDASAPALVSGPILGGNDPGAATPANPTPPANPAPPANPTSAPLDSNAPAVPAPAPNPAPAPAGLPQAFGCVLYRIIETDQTLELKPVEDQRKYETSFKASPPKAAAPTTLPRFRPEVSQVVRPRGSQRELVIQIMANVPLEEVTLISLERLPDGRDITDELRPALTLSGSGFRVDLDDRTPAGRYKITFSFKSPAIKNNPGTNDIEFQVRR